MFFDARAASGGINVGAGRRWALALWTSLALLGSASPMLGQSTGVTAGKEVTIAPIANIVRSMPVDTPPTDGFPDDVARYIFVDVPFTIHVPTGQRENFVVEVTLRQSDVGGFFQNTPSIPITFDSYIEPADPATASFIPSPSLILTKNEGTLNGTVRLRALDLDDDDSVDPGEPDYVPPPPDQPQPEIPAQDIRTPDGKADVPGNVVVVRLIAYTRNDADSSFFETDREEFMLTLTGPKGPLVGIIPPRPWEYAAAHPSTWSVIEAANGVAEIDPIPAEVLETGETRLPVLVMNTSTDTPVELRDPATKANLQVGLRLVGTAGVRSNLVQASLNGPSLVRMTRTLAPLESFIMPWVVLDPSLRNYNRSTAIIAPATAPTYQFLRNDDIDYSAFFFTVRTLSVVDLDGDEGDETLDEDYDYADFDDVHTLDESFGTTGYLSLTAPEAYNPEILLVASRLAVNRIYIIEYADSMDGPWYRMHQFTPSVNAIIIKDDPTLPRTRVPVTAAPSRFYRMWRASDGSTTAN